MDDRRQMFIRAHRSTISKALDYQVQQVARALESGVKDPEIETKVMELAYTDILRQVGSLTAAETIRSMPENLRKTRKDFDDDHAEAMAALEDYILLTVPTLALKSNDTIRRVITGAIATARADSPEEFTEEMILAEAAALMITWLTGPGESVIDTRTEHIVVNATSAGVNAGVAAGAAEPMLRLWNSVFSPTSREWHQAGHGQDRDMTEPFLIGGERMNFPGDSSLGASPSNFINCLCFLTYVEAAKFKPMAA